MRRIGAIAIILSMLIAAAPPAPPKSPERAPARPATNGPPIPTRVAAQTLTTICGQDRSACLTYILGSADAFAAALVSAGRPQVFCIPAGTTNDRIGVSVVAYLRAHPEEARTNASLVVLAGLKASYPCGY